MSLVKFQRRTSRFPTLTPFAPFAFNEDLPMAMRRLFDDVDMPLTAPMAFVPPTEIVETADELILSSELPGMSKKDVKIDIQDGVLTLSGEKIETRKEGTEPSYRMWERTYGSFERSFTLPRSVDVAKIEATFTDGVLHITMPKTTEARSKTRRIEIAEKV